MPRTSSLLDTLVWSTMLLLSIATLSIAYAVTPNPNGFGTHEQLGLAPCSFRRDTGIACPGCGLTTSVALTVRGALLRAFQTHPMGVCVVALLCTTIVVSVQGMSRSRRWQSAWESKPFVFALVATACVGLITFALRAMHLIHAP